MVALGALLFLAYYLVGLFVMAWLVRVVDMGDLDDPGVMAVATVLWPGFVAVHLLMICADKVGSAAQRFVDRVTRERP